MNSIACVIASPVLRSIGLIAVLLFSSGCWLVKEDHARGGGLEGETLTLAGTAVYSDGKPAVSARVHLRISDLSEDTSSNIGIDTITGPDGRFFISGVYPGEYFMTILDSSATAHFKSLQVQATGTDSRVMQLPTDTLKNTGWIRGHVTLPAGTGAAAKGVVQIPIQGTPFAIDSSGNFLIESVPPGTYFMRIVFTSFGMIHKLDNVIVKPGETTSVGNFTLVPKSSETSGAWPDSVSFALNTTMSGMALTENLVDFPLLVRLDSTNFPFAKVGMPGDGADLRFTDGQGKRLAFDIDSWDVKLQRAQIWVKVDTLYANRNDQTLRIHFGNKDVFSTSAPRSVFDKTFGPIAVWHFSSYNSGGQLANLAGVDNLLQAGNSESKTGLIGFGRLIGTGDELATLPSVTQELLSFTLSAWVHPDEVQASDATILWKARPGFSLAAYSLVWLGKENALEFAISKSHETPVKLAVKAPLPKGLIWTHVAATYDQTTGTGILYINGKASGTFKDPAPFTYGVSGGLYLGAKPGGIQAFKGILDEVRVDAKPWSATRVAAEYYSQKPGAILR